MGFPKEYMPAVAMVGVQLVAGSMALLNRAALVEGLNPRVFIFYRQAIATSVIAPIAFISGGKSGRCSMGIKSFVLISFMALIGVVLNQSFYYEGLYLTTSSIATAMSNLSPAITFIIAALIGLEKVKLKSLSTSAKILGTVLCVGGAICIALLRGPKLLNMDVAASPARMNNSLTIDQLGGDGSEDWLLGCVYLFANSCCWSLWLILLVPAGAWFPDHLALSAWMCFISTLQAGAVALFFERDPAAWNVSTTLQLTCCFFSGVVGSGVQFFLQSWCISLRGPLYSAMFSPLCTVIVTVLASIILHEEIYTGSLLGAIGVIIGLYVVLWGKAKEIQDMQADAGAQSNQTSANIQVDAKIVADSPEKAAACGVDLEQPLLAEKSHNRGYSQ